MDATAIGWIVSIFFGLTMILAGVLHDPSKWRSGLRMTRNDELVQAAIAILTRAGVTRAWRLGTDVGAELVVVLERGEFERLDAEGLTEELIEATRWKVWVTYKREPPGDLIRLI